MARPKKTVAAASRLIPRFFQVLRARGVDASRVASELGFPADAESHEELPVSPDDFEALLGAGARALGDPLLAVHLPDMIEWSSYNIGELAARSSPTLRDAFERVVRYAPLFYAHLAFSLVEEGGELILSQRLRAGTSRRYGNEYAVAASLSYARKYSGLRVKPIRVSFTHGAVPEAAALREFLETKEIRFDEAENKLVFDAADGRRPAVGHDARLLVTASEIADRALEGVAAPFDFLGGVTAKIRASLAGGQVDAAAIARRMKLGTRTLQRRLDENGTTFTDLLDKVRREVALEGVRDTSLTLSAVAERTGFSDVATFSRAFKRWTGSAPGEYRKSER